MQRRRVNFLRIVFCRAKTGRQPEPVGDGPWAGRVHCRDPLLQRPSVRPRGGHLQELQVAVRLEVRRAKSAKKIDKDVSHPWGKDAYEAQKCFEF